MIAIAESGSTKTAWFIVNENGITVNQFNTQGFNPDFHESIDISEALSKSQEIKEIGDEICKVYFYGASCSNKINNNKVKAGLMSVFPRSAIYVDHDLLACAYALTDGVDLITCILGTGSNSAYFDGEKLIEELPALGVFMGDEASGGYFGKQLIRDYFYKKLPVDMQEQLQKEYNLNWTEVRQIIYGSSKANVYLASFMPFIYHFHKHEYVKNMVREGIQSFIEVHIKCFQNYPSRKVGFVGTIAFLFQDIISQELRKHDFELIKVVKSPGKDLVKYLIDVKRVVEKSPESAEMN